MRELKEIFKNLTSSYERRIGLITTLLTFTVIFIYCSVSYIKDYNLMVEQQQRDLRCKVSGKCVSFGNLH